MEKSLNGEDKPENYFLLCPQCHAESPDTTDAKLFFAWVRYKRTHENYSMVLRRDMKKAAEILGVDCINLGCAGSAWMDPAMGAWIG